MAISHITHLIEHFKLENLRQQSRCFFCGGLHRTVECESPRREAFHLSIAAIAEQSRYDDRAVAGLSFGHNRQRGLRFRTLRFIQEVA